MKAMECPYCGEKGFDLMGLKVHLTGEEYMFSSGCEKFRECTWDNQDDILKEIN